MDLNEIREIIEQDGGKFIIVENGKPALVIMGFDEYKRKISVLGVKKINSTAISEIPEEENQSVTPSEQNDEVNIDDLPLD